MVAARLKALPETQQKNFDLAIELHRHGVNMRHLGLVRANIKEGGERNAMLRDIMLTEMVARTLKNVLRSFQRKWMKHQRSTSEQGMRLLGETETEKERGKRQGMDIDQHGRGAGRGFDLCWKLGSRSLITIKIFHAEVI